jgi:hypothetical protein
MVVMGAEMLFSALLFSDLNYFPAFVFAAMRAHPVRDFRLVAIGAFGKHRAAQRVMSAAR